MVRHAAVTQATRSVGPQTPGLYPPPLSQSGGWRPGRVLTQRPHGSDARPSCQSRSDIGPEGSEEGAALSGGPLIPPHLHPSLRGRRWSMSTFIFLRLEHRRGKVDCHHVQGPTDRQPPRLRAGSHRRGLAEWGHGQQAVQSAARAGPAPQPPPVARGGGR